MFLSFDPAILAIPNRASTQDEAESILQRLRYWAKPCFFSGMFQGVILADTLRTLAEGDYFPSGPNIVKLLNQWGLRHVYSAEDIRRSINFILERALIAEDVFNVEVSSGTLCKSEPDLSAYGNEAILFEATIRLLLTLSLAPPSALTGFLPIVVPGFPDIVGCVVVSASANEGAILNPGCDVVFPLSTFSQFLFVDTMGDLAAHAGGKRLWNSATNPEQLHFALTVEAMELLKVKGAACEPANVPTFKLGSRFFESAATYKATGKSGAHCDLLREACGRIIVGDPKYPIGTLDKPDSSGKMSPITRQRDGAVACRTHLQKSHEALRLMFWRFKDGTIEFANIGPKNELVIADGSAETVDKNECWDF